MSRNFEITYYTIASKKLPPAFNDTKLILLSDLHNVSYGEHNQKLLESIALENPDAIMIAGDLVIGGKEPKLEEAVILIEKLSEKYPVYYGNGNHEQKIDFYTENGDTAYKNYLEMLRRCKVIHLVNRTVEMEKKGETIFITGVEIELAYFSKTGRPAMTVEHLEGLLGKKKKDCFQILIAHNPLYFPEYAEWGADLVLSGHVHGGMVRLPGLGGVISPQFILFPHYDGGLYKEKASSMVLSRGLGAHTIKLRINNKPELAVIQLRAET